MLLFTDGLSEARSEEGVFLDREGVERLLSECRDCAPEQVADSLLEAARAFTGGRRLSDDTAVLWLEYTTAVGPVSEGAVSAPADGVASAAGHAFASSAGGSVAAITAHDQASGPLAVTQRA
jgi:hypothetical protein